MSFDMRDVIFMLLGVVQRFVIEGVEFIYEVIFVIKKYIIKLINFEIIKKKKIEKRLNQQNIELSRYC